MTSPECSRCSRRPCKIILCNLVTRSCAQTRSNPISDTWSSERLSASPRSAGVFMRVCLCGSGGPVLALLARLVWQLLKSLDSRAVAVLLLMWASSSLLGSHQPTSHYPLGCTHGLQTSKINSTIPPHTLTPRRVPMSGGV